ncbi:MAG: hypothetical protein HZB26_13775 [Candidatus Hydrogenedentes bacterium]|nr:hypothetical protein [Candidatus Hydrogenedentota bacterium]
MANFTTETAVRLKFHWHDTTLVPATLVQAGIDDAHTEILRFLDPVYGAGPADDALEMGETILAGANVARALAAQEASVQKRVTIGGQRVEEGARFTSLMALANVAETQAWYLLEPYLRDRAPRTESTTTDTQPVLGEL